MADFEGQTEQSQVQEQPQAQDSNQGQSVQEQIQTQTQQGQFDNSLSLEKEFEEGFALSKAEESDEPKTEQEPKVAPEKLDKTTQPEQTAGQQPETPLDQILQQRAQQVQSQQFGNPEQVAPQRPREQQPSQSPRQQDKAPQVQMIDLSADDELREEISELKKINPRAAWLAQTDTPEGEHVRRRLSQYGPEIAEDYAEFVFDRQDRAQREQQAYAQQQEAQRRAYAEQVQAANNAYYSAIQKEHADYFELLKDFDGGYGPQKRINEFRAYQQGIMTWINSKPYAEGARLMQIASNGNGPEVCALLTQYKQERQQRKTRSDPSGAMAVPNRGAATPPPGIGDQDSLDAGWITNQRESR